MFKFEIASLELIEVLYVSKAIARYSPGGESVAGIISVVHFLSALVGEGYGEGMEGLVGDGITRLGELSVNATPEAGRKIYEQYKYDDTLKDILNEAAENREGDVVTIQDILEVLSARRESINEMVVKFYAQHSSRRNSLIGSLFRNVAIARDDILREVRGQDHAVDRLLNAYIAYRLTRTGERKRPLSLLFFGDSGIGKSFLASTFHEAVSKFDAGLKFKMVDMANYFHNLSAELLFGGGEFNKVEGELSSFILANPRSVVVLDEFDRADVIVHSVLLRALGDGSIHFKGKDIPCHDVIFILTSNIASNLYGNEKTLGIYRDAGSLPQQVIKDSLKKSTKEAQHALIDRITEPVLFSPLGYTALKSLVGEKIDRLCNTWRAHGFAFEIENIELLGNMLLLHGGPSLSARDIEGLASRSLDFNLIKWFNANPDAASDLKKVRMAVDFDGDALFGEKRQFSLLCVDDSAGYVESLRGILPSVCSLVHTSTASEAMAYLAKNDSTVDLVLLDLNLVSDDYSTVFESDMQLRSDLRAALSLLHDIRKKYPRIDVYLHTNWNLDRYGDLQYNFIRLGGAAGYLPKVKSDDQRGVESFREKLDRILDELWWNRLSGKFSRRGKTLNFNTLITRAEETLYITYSRLHFVTTPLVEDLGWFTVEVPPVRFDDLIGIESVRMRLQEAIQYLKNPALFSAMDVKPPSGFILHGPPGTGKTSVAKAVANEADVPFISVNISSLFNKYVGETQENTRKLFRLIRKYSPVIVFIDELDSIGSRTGSNDNYGDSLRDEVINIFLQEMDGFSANDGVVFIGATNNLERIDEALRRPGRFGRALELEHPDDPAEIRKLIRKKLESSQKRLSPEELDSLAGEFSRWVVDMSPAEIIDSINEACLIAIRQDRDKITINDFIESRNLIKYGEKKHFQEDNPGEVEKTAIHEAGHALLNYLYGKDALQVTIVGRGSYAGLVERSQKMFTSREDAMQYIDVCLAGLAAERLLDTPEGIDVRALLGTDGRLPGPGNSPGVSSDLLNATTIAVNMHYRWGMIDGYLAAFDRSTVDDLAANSDLWKPITSLLGERLNHVNTVLVKCGSELNLLKDSLINDKTIFQSGITKILGDRDALRSKVLGH